MINNGLLTKASLPYAEALFELSQGMKSVGKTQQDLSLIGETLEQSTYLKNFLINPLVLSDVKKAVLSDLFLGQISSHVFNFLSLLIDRRRITLLSSIINCYLDLVYQLQLVTVADVYTANGFTESQKEALQRVLKSITDSKEVQLIFHIDAELIGGFIVKVGSKVIDMSIYGQLNQISSYLNGARF